MTLTIELPDDLEAALITEAQARGISPDRYARHLLKEALSHDARLEAQPIAKHFANLSDLLLNSPFAGANLALERSQDFPRVVDLG